MQGIDPAAGGEYAAFSDPFPSGAPIRVLVFADLYGASQSIAFVDGLSGARGRGEAAVRIVEESAFGPDAGLRDLEAARAIVEAEMAAVSPTAVVLSRFGHLGAAEAAAAAARAHGVPLLVHIDDELFDLPVTTGIERWRAARHPRRIAALARGLREADLVIAATETLAATLARRAGHGRIGWMENGTAAQPLPRSSKPAGEPVVIGYMASASHGPDLELVIPALTALLERRRDIRVELFGSIARQPAADRLPDAVVRHDVVAGDYMAFKRRLAGLGWDIGLAPLQATAYNRCKTATKWAEYAEAGAAVIASDVEVYAPMVLEGAAMPASPVQWEHALEQLIASPALREGLTGAADRMLAARFGWERLEASVLGLIGRAQPARAAA
jgi:glycosyltransferase involved in cell wall biosynthesis